MGRSELYFSSSILAKEQRVDLTPISLKKPVSEAEAQDYQRR